MARQRGAKWADNTTFSGQIREVIAEYKKCLVRNTARACVYQRLVGTCFGKKSQLVICSCRGGSLFTGERVGALMAGHA